MHKDSGGFTRTVAQVAGFGIGVMWFILAVVALISAARGFGNDRVDWGLGWGLVGTLLLAGSATAIIGTWWHLNRVASKH